MAAPNTEPDIEVVLFDLGGVLFDFGGVEPMKALSGIEDDEELWRRWLGCRWVRTFERGHCSPDAFASGVVADWSLPVTPEEYLVAFRTWVGGPLDGAAELVDETRDFAAVGCLSNTNVVHWNDHWMQWDILEAFDPRFLSFEVGCVKPDRELFEHVGSRLGCDRSRVLFLDDNVINVEGATAAGFRAMRAVGVADARRCLVEAGVLA